MNICCELWKSFLSWMERNIGHLVKMFLPLSCDEYAPVWYFYSCILYFHFNFVLGWICAGLISIMINKIWIKMIYIYSDEYAPVWYGWQGSRSINGDLIPIKNQSSWLLTNHHSNHDHNFNWNVYFSIAHSLNRRYSARLLINHNDSHDQNLLLYP